MNLKIKILTTVEKLNRKKFQELQSLLFSMGYIWKSGTQEIQVNCKYLYVYDTIEKPKILTKGVFSTQFRQRELQEISLDDVINRLNNKLYRAMHG